MAEPAQETKKQRKAAHRKLFTENNVSKLKAKAKQYLIWDAGTGASRGLAILVSPTGTKSYRCVYYYKGSSKPYHMHLGRVGEMSLEDARARTKKVRADAKAGIDPRADDPIRSDEFKVAVAEYIKLHQIGSEGNKSATKTEKVILKSCPEEWHKLPVGTIRTKQINDLLCLIRDGDADKALKPRPYLALRLHTHLKDFFSWCVRSKIINISPMVDMKRPWKGAKPRDRHWFKLDAGNHAIVSLWRAADSIGGAEARYLKMMLVTGKRKGALAEMRWEEIDRDWFWDAPASEVKNKRLHGIPLPKLAQRILHPRQSQGKVFGEINLDRLQRKIIKFSGIDDFFWHGLRHLVETKMAERRDRKQRSLIPPYLRDMLLDHAPQRGSGKDYDHHEYIPEMREAMEVWASHIRRVVETNVVPFEPSQAEVARARR